MSNERYPQPPQLSSATSLMYKKPENKKLLNTQSDEERDTSQADYSNTLKLSELRAHNFISSIAPVTCDHPDHVTPNREDTNENNEGEETLSSQEKPDQTNTQEETKEKMSEENYGGPWGIIKHTGYVTVAVWALLTAAATGAAAYFLTPGDYTWIALSVLGFMTGAIAAVDRKTHLIKNQHTILTAILTVPLALLAAINLGGWNILYGLISAIVIFGVFFLLIVFVNFGSGGDIKFAPIPAFALGVVNPMVAVLWLFYSLIITVAILAIRKQKTTSFGEGMAISLPLAIASVYGMYSLAGLPYMEVTP